jgi:non-specific serine/threonine protein kinase
MIEDPNEPRFEMLDTIREFAAEMLSMRGQQAELERRHGTWALQFATQASAELSGDDQAAWLERFEHAHDNLRVAMDRASARGDAEVAIGIAFHAWRFWQKRGHLNEARRRLDAMAAAPWSRSDPRLRARLVEALGGVCWWQGEPKPMRTAYAEAVELWRALGDRGELANALYNYSFAFTVPEAVPEAGTVVRDTDPTGEGRAALEEALAIFREIGDERGEGNVLWGLGNMRYFAFTQGDPDTGLEEFKLALEKFRRVGDRTMEAWSLHQLGSAYLRLGHLPEAREQLLEALRLFKRASDTTGLTLAFDDLSSLAVAEGDLERAARLWGAARNLTNATGAGLAAFVDEAVEYDARPNIRRDLSPEELTRLGNEGAAMPLDEMVEYALNPPPAAT